MTAVPTALIRNVLGTATFDPRRGQSAFDLPIPDLDRVIFAHTARRHPLTFFL
jgi:hypothetical protein